MVVLLDHSDEKVVFGVCGVLLNIAAEKEGHAIFYANDSAGLDRYPHMVAPSARTHLGLRVLLLEHRSEHRSGSSAESSLFYRDDENSTFCHSNPSHFPVHRAIRSPPLPPPPLSLCRQPANLPPFA